MTKDQTRREGKLALLTPLQMGDADQATKASNIDGFGLMEAAGSAVAVGSAMAYAAGYRAMRPRKKRRRWFCRGATPRGRGLAGEAAGEAAYAASLWKDPLAPFSSASLEGAGIVIDAVFGAGLSRPLDGNASRL